jgi:hypothetical protein
VAVEAPVTPLELKVSAPLVKQEEQEQQQQGWEEEQQLQVQQQQQQQEQEVVQSLFDKLQSFDVIQNGSIDSEEFKMYLQAVGVWNSEPAFTDEQWASSFPGICRMLGAPDSTQGMSLAEFTQYQETYRQGQAEADLKTLVAMDKQELDVEPTEPALTPTTIAQPAVDPVPEPEPALATETASASPLQSMDLWCPTLETDKAVELLQAMEAQHEAQGRTSQQHQLLQEEEEEEEEEEQEQEQQEEQEQEQEQEQLQQQQQQQQQQQPLAKLRRAGQLVFATNAVSREHQRARSGPARGG